MVKNPSVQALRNEPSDSLDDYPTPPWATRALLEHVIDGRFFKGKTAWEPSCNRGYMAETLWEYFGNVLATDIHNYGYPRSDYTMDFLEHSVPDGEAAVDWIITNPPFSKGADFVEAALDHDVEGVAIFVRTSFMAGQRRYRNLFSRRPPSIIAQFTERVNIWKGDCRPECASAAEHCWMVWHPYDRQTRFEWIKPCRKDLERADDYEL